MAIVTQFAIAPLCKLRANDAMPVKRMLDGRASRAKGE